MELNPDNLQYRRKRCDDCGFTKGTAANKSGLTDIKAMLCSEIPDVFLCHFNALDNLVAEGKEVVCQGWVEACNKLDAENFYARQSDWQRKLKIEIVEAISDIENRNLSEDEAIELMNQRIRSITERDSFVSTD